MKRVTFKPKRLLI